MIINIEVSSYVIVEEILLDTDWELEQLDFTLVPNQDVNR